MLSVVAAVVSWLAARASAQIAATEMVPSLRLTRVRCPY